VEAGVALSGLEKAEVLMASNKDNTSQGKGWIFDSGSTVHVCSQKELFNSLVAKEEEIVKMLNSSICEVIDTESQDYTKRWDGAYSGGGPIYLGGMLQSNIHKGA